jgi:hypothetical protein
MLKENVLFGRKIYQKNKTKFKLPRRELKFLGLPIQALTMGMYM